MSDLSDADLELVRWVADSRIGDPLPGGWDRHGTDPLVQHLVDIGVVHSAYVGMLIEDAAVAAQRDCREWLESHI